MRARSRTCAAYRCAYARRRVNTRDRALCAATSARGIAKQSACKSGSVWLDLALLDEALNLLSEARDEEQDYYDNMPESFQNGDKGEAAQDAVNNLNGACGSIEDASSTLSNIG